LRAMKLTVRVGVVLMLAALVLASVFRYEETVATPDQPLIVRTDRWTGQQSIWDAATGQQVESVAGFFEEQRNAAERARRAVEQARFRAELEARATQEAQAVREQRGRLLREALATRIQAGR